MSTETQSIASAPELTDEQRRELWREYDRRKYAWITEHPGASAYEYGQAIQQIADELGV